MAPMSETDERNDVASSEPQKAETTATKHLNYSIGTLTSPSSSSITPVDSHHIPPLPTLPFELIVEILFKLPVKSLMKFQCVCKSWKSLISDPNFAKKHFRVSTMHHHLISTFTNPTLIHMAYFYPLSSVFTEVTAATAMQLEYPLVNRRRIDKIVGNCHGILCFAVGNFALLWNPSIRKFTKSPSLEYPYHDVFGFSFGYDDVSDSYKVVAVCSINDGSRAKQKHVKVHTLGTNSWRTIQDFPSHFRASRSLLEESGKFVSGTINWLADRHGSTSRVIISVDLEKESCLELMRPNYGSGAAADITLTVLRDCLCIFSHGDVFSDVWLMKEYGNKDSWIKLFRVPHMRDLGCYPSVFALYLSEDDKVLLDTQLNLVVYNSRDGTFKDPFIQNTNNDWIWLDSEVYHESLISPCF